jgi:hypothetical protein
MASPTPTGYFWECPNCRTPNAAGSRQCRACGAANPSGPAPAKPAAQQPPPVQPTQPLTPPPATTHWTVSQPKNRGCWRWGCWGCLVVFALFVGVLVVGVVFVNQAVDQIRSDVDTQQEFIDDIPTVRSCATLWSYVAFSQEIIAGNGFTDEGFYGTPYGEQLGEAAEARLDRLGCKG